MTGLAVKREVDASRAQAAIVVSAGGGWADQPIEWVRQASAAPSRREQDAVVAAAENLVAGLMAIALGGLGIVSSSFLGWQVPIRSDEHHHGAAAVVGLDMAKVLAVMAADQEPVITGAQGISPSEAVTMLSDPSDVAATIATALGGRVLVLAERGSFQRFRSPAGNSTLDLSPVGGGFFSVKSTSSPSVKREVGQ